MKNLEYPDTIFVVFYEYAPENIAYKIYKTWNGCFNFVNKYEDTKTKKIFAIFQKKPDWDHVYTYTDDNKHFLVGLGYEYGHPFLTIKNSDIDYLFQR